MFSLHQYRGATFQMNTVLSEICDAVTTRLSGAVDSVMFSHSDLISRWAGIVFESCYRFSHFSFLFCYVKSYLEHFSTGLPNGRLIGRLFDRKPNKLLQMF